MKSIGLETVYNQCRYTAKREKVSTCSTLVVDIREVVSILEMVAVITTWRVDELSYWPGESITHD
jgi:hypothetical protein